MSFNFNKPPPFRRPELADVAARAFADDVFPDLELHDSGARALARALHVDRTGFPEGELRSLASRTRLVDDVVRDFFRRYPEGLAIGLFSGPCTRFSRVDNGLLHWVDLDVPYVAEWKTWHAPQTPRYTIASGCCACHHWLDRLAEAPDCPTLLIGVGRFSMLGSEPISTFLTHVTLRLGAGVEILLDATPMLRLQASVRGRGQRLELHREDGATETYPWLQVLSESEHPEPLASRIQSTNRSARLARSDAQPVLCHIRVG
ncbi:class I SAM-dependent methyltransferase [Chondromyces crocatus]|uniref:O-methyltransferase-related protein n=1 Tax=Chondromyces crocatus TaxID=52 RepID=A0A0K1EGD0_CHOCO|nr:methyltransferase [Chondromyces crocatus]AKT39633.1 O-methyltransferase-related protein [Chondromyces crocatus]